MIRHLGSSLTDVTYVFDEPTTGPHLADVEQLLGLFDRLVDAGKSVIVIEHHQGVMAHADLVAARPTLTGERLAAYVGSGALDAAPQRRVHP